MAISLEEHVVRLVKALEPFAALADRYPKLIDDYPLWAARFSNQYFAQRDLTPIVKVGEICANARAAIAAMREREGAANDPEIASYLAKLDDIAENGGKDGDHKVTILASQLATLTRMAAADATRGSPSPDPAEAMRAKCEMIAWDYAEAATADDTANDVANSIKRSIAALKGNGEGK